MLIAENKMKEVTDLSKLSHEKIEKLRKIKWYCPGCKSEVLIKNGSIIRPHFSHKSRQTCWMFSENESDEHLKGKQLIAENCERFGIEYRLEAYLPDIQQRPDVLIKKNIAIEFQCSSLSVDRFKERSEAYLKQGYQVIWVLGKNFHLGKQLSHLQKQFIYFSQKVGFYMWELDTEKELITLTYFILKLPAELTFKRKKFSLSKENLIDLLAYPYDRHIQEKLVTSPIKNYQEQKNKWNQQLNVKQSRAMMLQAFFYGKGQNLRDISELYFFPSFLTPLLMEEELILRYLVYDYFVIHQKGELENVLVYIKTEREFNDFVLIGKDRLLSYCVSLYLCYLRNKGVIQEKNKCYYLVKDSNSSGKFKWEILWLPLKYVMISK